jgi:hypothetical protein
MRFKRRVRETLELGIIRRHADRNGVGVDVDANFADLSLGERGSCEERDEKEETGKEWHCETCETESLWLKHFYLLRVAA